MDLSKLDVVYVFRPWPSDSIELRYSLRSLINIPHRNVYIVGALPNWINKDKVIHIPATDEDENPYKNVIRKYITICNTEEISDNFILMNDDIYFLKPTAVLPYYTQWTLKEYLNRIQHKNTGKFYKNVEKVYKLFPKGNAFNTHTPIIYNKANLLKLIDKYKEESINIRSLYCNHYKIKWTSFYDEFGRYDIKIRNNRIQSIQNLSEMRYLSTNWDVNYKAKQFLDNIFEKYYYFEL